MKKAHTINLSLVVAVAIVSLAGTAFAQAPKTPAEPAAPAGNTNCKNYSTAKCCDPAMTAHLTKEAVFNACGKSDSTYLGERGGKDECRYYFKVEGEKDADMYVSVNHYTAKPGKPSEPQDPFVTWKKVGGNTYIAQPKTIDKKASAKVKAVNMSSAVGVYKSGNGWFVLVSAPSKVCTQADAKKLAGALK